MNRLFTVSYSLLRSFSKYRLLAAANFELIAIGVFEKEGVVTRAVRLANLGPLELFPARFAHQLCNPIHFLPRISPKRDACAVRLVILIWTKAKEFRRLVADGGKKSMKVSTGFFVNESKLWQKFSVKLFRRFHVGDTQIDVIEAPRFHWGSVNGIGSQFNRFQTEGGHCRASVSAPNAFGVHRNALQKTRIAMNDLFAEQLKALPAAALDSATALQAKSAPKSVLAF